MKMTLTQKIASPALASLILFAPLTAQKATDKPETEASATATAKESAKKEKTATKKDKEVISVVRFKGTYADFPEAGGDLTSLLMGGGGGQPKSFFEMLEQLSDAGGSDSTKILFDLSSTFSINQVQMSELERTLTAIKKKGKTFYAYLEGASITSYQIAAMCDEIMIADLGTLDVPSRSMSIMFMKDALDLLGVKMDVVRCGTFKGAVEPYMLPAMSKHLRAHYMQMLERLNDDIVARIAKGRSMSKAQVRAMQSQRLITAQRAKDDGLVDHLVTWEGAEEGLARILGHHDFRLKKALYKRQKKQQVNPLTMLANMMNPKEKKTKVEDDSLVILHMQGTIIDGEKATPGSIVSGPTVKLIRNLTNNDKVKGVVLRVNSPGGSATASEAILLAMRKLAAAKPVVVSMGSVAASGGYYVTCFGRPILAEVGTVTGSIGVFGTRPNVGALMRRVGLHEETIALDEGSTMTSIASGWSDGQKQRVQNMVNQIYDVFTGHVSRSRGLTTNEVLAIAGGRVWSGEQAVANGLVDRIGGIDDALAMLTKDVNDFEILHLPKPGSMLDSFAEMFGGVKMMLDDPRARLITPRLERAIRMIADALEARSPVRIWTMLPETFEIR